MKPLDKKSYTMRGQRLSRKTWRAMLLKDSQEVTKHGVRAEKSVVRAVDPGGNRMMGAKLISWKNYSTF